MCLPTTVLLGLRPQKQRGVAMAPSCRLGRAGKHKSRDGPDLFLSPCLSPFPQLSILQEQPRKDAGDITLSSSPSSSSSSSTLTPNSAGLQDPSLSCPGTPSPHHGKLAAMQGVGCPSPVSTLKRPTALSRHASAAGLVSKHPKLFITSLS